MRIYRQCVSLAIIGSLMLWGASEAFGQYETRRDVERRVGEVLQAPGEWDHEPLQDEWEYETNRGEVTYDPDGDFNPRSSADIERRIRRELEGAGYWEWQPLQREWEYKGRTGEIEYETTWTTAAPFQQRYYTTDWWRDGGEFDRWWD